MVWRGGWVEVGVSLITSLPRIWADVMSWVYWGGWR